jgi:uncharacterized protein with GYD domain
VPPGPVNSTDRYPTILAQKEVLWLQGQHDLVVISEAADEIASTAFTLNTYKMGNVRGQTFRAFTAAEMEKILEKVA